MHRTRRQAPCYTVAVKSEAAARSSHLAPGDVSSSANRDIMVRRRPLSSFHRRIHCSRPSTPHDRALGLLQAPCSRVQSSPQRVVVGELDAVLDMTDGEIADRRQNLTRLLASPPAWRRWSGQVLAAHNDPSSVVPSCLEQGTLKLPQRRLRLPSSSRLGALRRSSSFVIRGAVARCNNCVIAISLREICDLIPHACRAARHDGRLTERRNVSFCAGRIQLLFIRPAGQLGRRNEVAKEPHRTV
jgi:hypothetical protein